MKISQHQSFKIGIKYCGGCNPRYNRTKAIQTLLSSFPDIIPEYDITVFCPVWLLICGCPSSCVNSNSLLAERVLTASSLNDVLALRSTLEKLSDSCALGYIQKSVIKAPTKS